MPFVVIYKSIPCSNSIFIKTTYQIILNKSSRKSQKKSRILLPFP